MQVVDAGFSFTHALPLFDGQVLLDGVRRINLGGKALTNYFKELVSYRYIFYSGIKLAILMAAPASLVMGCGCSGCYKRERYVQRHYDVIPTIDAPYQSPLPCRALPRWKRLCGGSAAGTYNRFIVRSTHVRLRGDQQSPLCAAGAST